jgi:hypothetical protein
MIVPVHHARHGATMMIAAAVALVALMINHRCAAGLVMVAVTAIRPLRRVANVVLTNLSVAAMTAKRAIALGVALMTRVAVHLLRAIVTIVPLVLLHRVAARAVTEEVSKVVAVIIVRLHVAHVAILVRLRNVQALVIAPADPAAMATAALRSAVVIVAVATAAARRLLVAVMALLRVAGIVVLHPAPAVVVPKNGSIRSGSIII